MAADAAQRIADDLLAGSRGELTAEVAAHQAKLHEIPELAFEERATARYVHDALQGLGLTPVTGLAGTGLLAELPGAGDGPTVLVRADMDGLPIEEDGRHAPRSRNAGRMHACGHDGHMAMALGLSAAVCRGAARGARLPGRLLVVFQPAEETGRGGPSGGQQIAKSGLFDEHGVDYVLGLHLWSFKPLGVALIPPGTVLASADEFTLTFRGPGGHAALPHLARDTVLAASQTVVSLQSVVSRDVDPVTPAVVSIGSIHAGHAPNVLPAEAALSGTLRAADRTARERLRERVAAIARATAAAHGIDVELQFTEGYPPTVNDPAAARIVREAATEVLGPGAVLEGPPTMAAEDFSFFLEERPGAFVLLGMADEASGAVHPHHSPRFRIAPGALPLGLEILLRGAVALMAHGERRGA